MTIGELITLVEEYRNATVFDDIEICFSIEGRDAFVGDVEFRATLDTCPYVQIDVLREAP